MSAAIDISNPDTPKRVAIVASNPSISRQTGCGKSHAVRDGNLITGQQQYSAAAVARLIVEALGV